jgi:hypothetical protein
MQVHLIAVGLVLALAACSPKPKQAEIEPTPQLPAKRSEPIFYNGKTYQLDYVRNDVGAYAMSVGGMTAKQQFDATAVATSSLRYFACPDGQTGTLTDQPSYVSGKWKMTAICQ